MQIGIDEVGRGCWAGPLVVAAVRLLNNISGITDSKVISPKKRIALANKISKHSQIGLGWVSSSEVDNLGLTAATTLGIERALSSFTSTPTTKIIIDGSYKFIPDVANVTTLVGADMTIPSVGAASIVAKVTRDTYMHEQAVVFPDYGFDRHVGYGTKQHREALERHGPCELHRTSYKPI